MDGLAAWKSPSKVGGWWLSIGRAQLPRLPDLPTACLVGRCPWRRCLLWSCPFEDVSLLLPPPSGWPRGLLSTGTFSFCHLRKGQTHLFPGILKTPAVLRWEPLPTPGEVCLPHGLCQWSHEAQHLKPAGPGSPTLDLLH